MLSREYFEKRLTIESSLVIRLFVETFCNLGAQVIHIFTRQKLHVGIKQQPKSMADHSKTEERKTSKLQQQQIFKKYI